MNLKNHKKQRQLEEEELDRSIKNKFELIYLTLKKQLLENGDQEGLAHLEESYRIGKGHEKN